ncbi:MAG: site-specific integrase [Chitinophagia bacterium]|nr:site-specific integrase [Chitinophagia bacterium]NCA31010.1 site-specific integrase [Chitinophagia bacterium]
MKVLFWLYKSRVNSKGTSPVKMRITINADRIDFSTSIEVSKEKWDQQDQRVRGMDELAIQYNNTLSTLRSLAWDCYNKKLRNKQPVTVELIKAEILGRDKPNYTILEAIDFQVANLTARVGNDVSINTVKKYKTIKLKVTDFLQSKLRRNDYYLLELSNKFIFDFDSYLRTDGKLSHNAVAKNMQQLKRVITVSIQNEWLPKDPFPNYRITPKETERGFLSLEEVELISKVVLIERLDKVRDVFLFCCFTGLSYADVSKLNPYHLFTGEDGHTWIKISRTKTGTQSLIPVIPQALFILDKYKPVMNNANSELLLPIISNQNLNKYLKEIGEITGIKKRLSMHLGRHTFATTITLNKGVDIVSVSKMLGHKNLKVTQVYAKTSMLKISDDMKRFFRSDS